MICGVCMKKSKKGTVTEYGLVCAVCLPGIREREEALYRELLEEDMLSVPPFLDVEAFERFALKFAVHYLRKLPAEHKEHMRQSKPHLLRPRPMALFVKDRIIEKMPLYYVSSMAAEGRDRLFHAGTYEFKKDVPDSVLLEAIRASGFITLEGEGENG